MGSHRWPAEWEHQWAVLLIWPHEAHAWKDTLKETELSYLTMVKAITAHQSVFIVARDQAHWLHIHSLVKSLSNKYPILHALIETNDTWARDTGPICIYKNNQRIALDFEFNAWGGKFDYTQDNQMNRQLAESPHFKAFSFDKIDLVLEGGSIESDGHGTLLTTKSCLANANRNPNLESSKIHAQLSKLLHVDKIIELDVDPLEGDDTDGHIDTLARFCDPQTLCYLSDGTNNPPLKNLEEQLRSLKRHDGSAYTLVPLPYSSLLGHQGQPVPATYANFLIINGAVLVPEYGIACDQIAQQQIKQCFPDRVIYPIPARPFIEQGGSVHCLTMQLPGQVC